MDLLTLRIPKQRIEGLVLFLYRNKPHVSQKSYKEIFVKLWVYKSTTVLENARKLFKAYSEVSDLLLRNSKIVLMNKEPGLIEHQNQNYIYLVKKETRLA
jgi:hypothetical protein